MGEISLHAAYELMRQAVSSGEHEKVAGIALHVLQYFPQNLKAKLYLGEAYIAAQKLDEAHAMLSEVCECDPENIVAQVGLSAIAERRGELLMATQHLDLHIPHRLADGLCPVGHDRDIQIGGQGHSQLRQKLLNAIDHLNHIGAGLSLHIQNNGWLRIGPGC